jgi:hypothetical protein
MKNLDSLPGLVLRGQAISGNVTTHLMAMALSHATDQT